jgi:hypothetical protein
MAPLPTSNPQSRCIMERDTVVSAFIGPHAQHRRLLHPLGPWLSDCDMSSEWWYSPSLNALLQQNSPTWSLYPFIEDLYGHQYFKPSLLTHPYLPADSVRASVLLSGHRYCLLNKGIHHCTIPPPVLLTIQDHIAALPSGLQWAIQHLDAPDGFDTIAQAISSFKGLAVTDGLLKDTCGTAAFTLVADTDFGRISSVNIVPGPIKHQAW